MRVVRRVHFQLLVRLLNLIRTLYLDVWVLHLNVKQLVSSVGLQFELLVFIL